MDGQEGLIGKELIFDSGDLQVMFQIAGHVGLAQAFQMASGHDSGGEGPGSVIHEFIEQIIMTGEDGGHETDRASHPNPKPWTRHRKNQVRWHS